MTVDSMHGTLKPSNLFRRYNTQVYYETMQQPSYSFSKTHLLPLSKHTCYHSVFHKQFLFLQTITMSCFEPGVEHSNASYIDVSKVVCVFTCVCKHVYVTQRISLPLFLGPTDISIEDMI